MEQSHNSHHVLLFPFPANGHIKPFLCLAQLLCNAGLEVTVLNTDHNHDRLDNRSRLSEQFPTLHFESIPDGLPPDEPRNVLDMKFYVSMLQATPPLFRELLMSYDNNRASRSRVTCVITDVIMRFPIEVAEELGIPVFSFCIFSARFLFLYHWTPYLYEDGQLPPLEAGNTNQKIHGVPGGEGLLRRKDLPGYLGVHKVAKDNVMKLLNQTTTSSRTSGLIINTFDELEAPFLASLSKIYKKIYTVGPIHSLLKNSPCGLWKEDHRCLAWLDSQAPRSVVFVCFGSLVKITCSQLMEFWNGLINSGKAFLLALRSDIVEDDDDEKQVVKEIMETKLEGRCLVVSWAPQEEVLAHEAIGGFLSHAGWNSILETIVAGVPMICWPQIGDHPSNCTWVSKVWKIGFEMEDQNDRATVEAMVKSIMEHDQNQDMKNRIEELKEQVKNRVSKDGISNQNIKTLVEDIKKVQLN